MLPAVTAHELKFIRNRSGNDGYTWLHNVGKLYDAESSAIRCFTKQCPANPIRHSASEVYAYERSFITHGMSIPSRYDRFRSLRIPVLAVKMAKFRRSPSVARPVPLRRQFLRRQFHTQEPADLQGAGRQGSRHWQSAEAAWPSRLDGQQRTVRPSTSTARR
jgi:hypothetical protein